VIKSYPKKYYAFLIAACLLMVAAFVYEAVYLKKLNNRIAIQQRVQGVMDAKAQRINTFMKQVAMQLENNNTTTLNKQLQQLKSPMSDFVFFIYKNGQTIYWSNNSVELGFNDKAHIVNEQIGYWASTYYEFFKQKTNNYQITGLLFIKRSQAGFENKYIVNQFNSDFELTDNVIFASNKSTKQNFEIVNSRKQTLFSLLFEGEAITPVSIAIPYLFFLSLACLAIWLYTFVNYYIRTEWVFAFVCLLAVMVTYYLTFVVFKLPRSLFELTLFSPLLYASGNLLGSMGHLIMITMWLLFIALIIYRNISLINYNGLVLENQKIKLLSVFAVFFCMPLYGTLIHYLIRGLILNSKLSYDLTNILGLTHYSFIGMAIILVLMWSVYLLCASTAKFIEKTQFTQKQTALYFISSQLLFIAIKLIFNDWPFFAGFEIPDYIFCLAVILITYFILISNHLKHSFYSTLVLVILYALFSSKTISGFNHIKENNERKSFADRIENQQDLLAEFLFEDLASKIANDKVILSYAFESNKSTYIDIDAKFNIENRLKQNYFNGYWSAYAIESNIFDNKGNALAGFLNDAFSLAYYDEIIETECEPTEAGNLFALKNKASGTAYIAKIAINNPADTAKPLGHIVLELNSKITKSESGYPDFLISQKQANKLGKTDYAYAIYKNGIMVNQSGNFPFAVNDHIYIQKLRNQRETFYTDAGVSFYVLKPNANNTILVSRKQSLFENFVTLSSYVFVLFFSTACILYFIYKLINNQFKINFNFKNRIQLTVTSLIMLMMFSAGTITTINLINSYNNSQNQKIIEKINSVLLIIENETRSRPFNRNQIETNYQYKFAEISSSLNADFNIYDTLGMLIYTTQPKVFELDILGQHMHRNAYNELAVNPKLNLVQHENIGNLNYLAAYEPIRNHANKTIAYLNVPYFKTEADLHAEVSDLIKVLTNIYVPIFLLSVILTLFFSRKLARPLQLIQINLSKVRLDQSNPLIEWDKKDEIGALVGEYNRMVLELKSSAEALAQSERETAWREMARQVAHEIKNPLTPMKLSVQFLQRALKDKSDDLEKLVKRTSDNLVVQIDTLSHIASEFSNFAKMPTANNAVIDLQLVLKNTSELYDAEDETKIIFHQSENDMLVFADRDQLLRVFSNLLKNALQAITNPKRGIITVTVSADNDMYMVAVSDNGSGIPTDQRDKIFMPNFTTKTTGSGLGLAMSKQIIDSAAGKMWFETEIDKGTTFFVSLPKHIAQ